ncbi:MAG: hypothetical protein ACRYHQ_39730 [Janthinobacterium lividum]
MIAKLAKAYHAAVHAASTSLIRGEKEAQLTTPVSNLLIGLSEAAKFGALRLIRETRLHHTRPDFAAELTRNGNTRQKGFIELKAPNISVNAWSWSGRNRRQWANMHHEAGVLIVSNGVQAQLYKTGVPVGEPASLPYAEFRQWDPEPLILLLCCFFDLNPTTVSSHDMPSRSMMQAPDPSGHCPWMLHEAAIS